MVTKVIILAAGKGTRMASYSNTGPKCLLEFKGEPLLKRQLSSFEASGINEFIIVGGYMIEQIEEFAKRNSFNIKLIYNPFYENTNSIASLWFARDFFEGDVLITNGDTYFDKNIFKLLTGNKNKYIFGVDESKRIDADYRVTLSEGEIFDMGKDILEDEVMAEYIGIALIRKNGIQLFKELLEKSIKNGNHNLWWEDLFVELMAKCERISYVDVTGELWFEIDEPKDYRRCQRYF